MAYEFKNLNEVPVQDKPTNETTVMAFEGGIPKQIPADEFGGKAMIVDLRNYTPGGDNTMFVHDMSYDPIYESIMNGKQVMFLLKLDGSDGYLVCCGAVTNPGVGCYAFTCLMDIIFSNGSYHGATAEASE